MRYDAVIVLKLFFQSKNVLLTFIFILPQISFSEDVAIKGMDDFKVFELEGTILQFRPTYTNKTSPVMAAVMKKQLSVFFQTAQRNLPTYADQFDSYLNTSLTQVMPVELNSLAEVKTKELLAIADACLSKYPNESPYFALDILIDLKNVLNLDEAKAQGLIATNPYLDNIQAIVFEKEGKVIWVNPTAEQEKARVLKIHMSLEQ